MFNVIKKKINIIPICKIYINILYIITLILYFRIIFIISCFNIIKHVFGIYSTKKHQNYIFTIIIIIFIKCYNVIYNMNV